jgi:dissimilatory sulfite reductase (desulfoviridin) alpha/beta subunit
MEENIDEDRRVIERNGFKKFLEEILGKISVKAGLRDVTTWNMISKNHMLMLKSLESKPDATLSSIFCS